MKKILEFNEFNISNEFNKIDEMWGPASPGMASDMPGDPRAVMIAAIAVGVLFAAGTLYVLGKYVFGDQLANIFVPLKGRFREFQTKMKELEKEAKIYEKQGTLITDSDYIEFTNKVKKIVIDYDDIIQKLKNPNPGGYINSIAQRGINLANKLEDLKTKIYEFEKYEASKGKTNHIETPETI